MPGGMLRLRSTPYYHLGRRAVVLQASCVLALSKPEKADHGNSFLRRHA
jgi:hypothetical protein